MQVKVTNKVITLEQEKIGTNNVNTIECEFDLCEEFEGLTPIAVFTANGTTYKENIIENKCMIPHEVLENEGIVELGVYGFEVTGEELVKRYSPVSTYFPVEKGSYKEGEESVDATPNSFEYYLNACNTAKENAEIAETNAETAEANAQASAESASASATNVETIASNFNANATEKTNAFNTNAETKETEFDENAESKTNTFNANANTKKTEFNTNASAKETAFNSNATEKTNAFNSNAESKKTDFDSNATTKTTEFNTNYETKKALIDEVSTSVVQERKISDNKYAFALEGNTEGQMINLNDVQEGTDIKDYKIYGNATQETRSGKNKLKLVDSTSTFNGITFAVNNGKITISGTATSVYSQAIQKNCNIPAGTYKFVTDDTSLTYGIWLYNSSNTLIATIKSRNNNIEATINETASKYNLIVEGIVNGTTYNKTIKPMLMLTSETDTTYEPYGAMPSPEYPSEIQSVGDLVTEGEHAGKYRVPVVCSNGTDTTTTDIYLDNPLYSVNGLADYIDFENSRIVRELTKKDITSTGGITLTRTNTNTLHFRLFAYVYDTNKPYYINRFVYVSRMSLYDVEGFNIVGSENGNLALGINKQTIGYVEGETSAETVAKFKTWLDNNDIYTICKLATPTEEDITLPSISTFADTTTIEVDTTTPVSNIEVKYNKDINKAFANLQAQILALGGE